MSKYQLPKPDKGYKWQLVGLVNETYVRVHLEGTNRNFHIGPDDNPRKVYRKALRLIQKERDTLMLVDRAESIVREANGY